MQITPERAQEVVDIYGARVVKRAAELVGQAKELRREANRMLWALHGGKRDQDEAVLEFMTEALKRGSAIGSELTEEEEALAEKWWLVDVFGNG